MHTQAWRFAPLLGKPSGLSILNTVITIVGLFAAVKRMHNPCCSVC
jgi:hypothetical protein